MYQVNSAFMPSGTENGIEFPDTCEKLQELQLGNELREEIMHQLQSRCNYYPKTSTVCYECKLSLPPVVVLLVSKFIL
jgi:hypothetical protein